MFKRLFSAATLFGLLAATPPALAQSAQQCAPRDVVVAKLKTKHGESARAVGISGGRAAFEIWASSEKGSWTMLVTRTNKMSCIIASGDTWVELPPDFSSVGQPAAFKPDQTELSQ